MFTFYYPLVELVFFTCRDTHFPGWIHPPCARHDVRWRLPQLSHSRLPNHVQLSTRGVGTPRHVQCVQMRGLRWARWEWWAEGELEWVSRVYLCSKNRMDVWRTATSGRVTSAHARNHVFDDRWRHLLRVNLLPRTWKQGVGPAWKHGDVYVCSGMLRNGHTHTHKYASKNTYTNRYKYSVYIYISPKLRSHTHQTRLSINTSPPVFLSFFSLEFSLSLFFPISHYSLPSSLFSRLKMSSLLAWLQTAGICYRIMDNPLPLTSPHLSHLTPPTSRLPWFHYYKSTEPRASHTLGTQIRGYPTPWEHVI